MFNLLQKPALACRSIEIHFDSMASGQISRLPAHFCIDDQQKDIYTDTFFFALQTLLFRCQPTLFKTFIWAIASRYFTQPRVRFRRLFATW